MEGRDRIVEIPVHARAECGGRARARANSTAPYGALNRFSWCGRSLTCCRLTAFGKYRSSGIRILLVGRTIILGFPRRHRGRARCAVSDAGRRCCDRLLTRLWLPPAPPAGASLANETGYSTQLNLPLNFPQSASPMVAAGARHPAVHEMLRTVRGADGTSRFGPGAPSRGGLLSESCGVLNPDHRGTKTPNAG